MVKQEPTAYSWDDFMKDGKTDWTGVRNFKARLFLKDMKKGDKVYFYHSVVGKEVVGIAEVTKEAFPDPTDTAWHAVELKPVKPLKKPVTLEAIKKEPKLKDMALIKLSRLSVQPVTDAEWKLICKMGEL